MTIKRQEKEDKKEAKAEVVETVIDTDDKTASTDFSKPRTSNGGRPKLKLDYQRVEEMAASFLPVEQIASILDCTTDTLYSRFSSALRRGQSNRRHQLTCAMWHKALVEKDTKMMIWLSKQHLGYRENMMDNMLGVQFNITINEIPK